VDPDDLQNELNKLKHLFDDRFNQMMKLIEKKADKEDLDALERRLMEKLNDLIRGMIDRFADKKDTNKRLSALEKQIKTLFDLLMNQESQRSNGQEDDAMFTKKPLGGVSCASCEKNITNLQGLQAEYQPWKRLPFKDPGERISRYGPGFSKILQMLRPERSTEYSTHVESQFRKTSHNNSLEEVDPLMPGQFHTQSTLSPDIKHGNNHVQHYDHLLPKTIN